VLDLDGCAHGEMFACIREFGRGWAVARSSRDTAVGLDMMWVVHMRFSELTATALSSSAQLSVH
jgi:hypothetical protein